MTTICYYISDYGYGHAARSLAIIRSLLSQAGRQVRVIVCSAKTLPFLRQSLAAFGDAVDYRRTSSDLGYVLQEGSIEADPTRFRLEYSRYVRMFPHFIEMEYRFMRQERIDLVITDISPIACAAAKLAGIVSVGISNFTWYTAYRDLLDEPLLEPLYQAYGQMDCFISLAGAQEPLWGRKEHTQAGFFCRCPEPREIERLKSLMKTDGVEAIVFFALGMSIQVEDLTEMAMWDDESCLFVVSSNMAIDRKNVLRIPEDYTESQNYLAASDLVITKPGWGTISEAVGLVKPLVLLDRGVFPEDRSTAAALEGRHPYLHMEWERLKTIRIKEALSVLTDIDVNLASGNASQINLQQITNYLFGLLDHRERSLAMERGESCQSEFPKGESC